MHTRGHAALRALRGFVGGARRATRGAQTASSQTRRAASCPRITGEPHRPSPINAASRAASVESCSGDGSGRVSSENCTTRPGVGSTATVTRSIAASGGCDSRSSSASVRSVRASRIGAGNCSDRSWIARVTRCRRTCSTAAPRSRRSRCADERLHQPAEHERERLEPFDRPLEFERLLEPLLRRRRHERPRVLAARDALPARPPSAQAAPPLHPAAAPRTRRASVVPTGGACQADRSDRSDVRVVRNVRVRDVDAASSESGNEASSSASRPGSITVRPAR